MFALFNRTRRLFSSIGLSVGFSMVINLYSWFFPLYILYERILRNLLANYTTFEYVIGSYCASALVFAFVGVLLVNRTKNRDTVLISWMLTGIAASLLFGFVPNLGGLPYLYFFSSLLGASLGFGFPSFLAYFADYNNEERGRHAGIAFFASGIGIVVLGAATALFPLIVNVAIFAAWRTFGCVVFLLRRPKEKMEIRPDISYRSILEQRAFLLYFVPWIIYCIINYFEASLLEGFFGSNFSYFVPVAEFGIGAFVALLGGYFSDVVGRRVVIVFGYVALGIGYAILGLFPYNRLSWYFYVGVDSISGGIFAFAFFLLIWGELSANMPKEKYFLLGGMPYLILSYIGILLEPYIKLIPVSSAFPLAAFFLFMAILPLMYAPETLPEKQLKDRELRQYLEKARKTKEKYV